MNTRTSHKHNPALYEGILSLHTVEECLQFFEDLCTMSELSAMEQRYQVARALHDGKIYNEILAETGASTATISRVNRTLQYGAGGYELVFDRLAMQDDSVQARTSAEASASDGKSRAFSRGNGPRRDSSGKGGTEKGSKE